MTRGTCPSLVFSLEELKLSASFYLGGKNLPIGRVNLPLGENALLLEEHFLNLLVSLSLEVLNLTHGGIGLSTSFSLGRTNSSFEEFVLPFGENFLSWENWLNCYVSLCIPFTELLLDGGSIQIATHSFF